MTRSRGRPRLRLVLALVCVAPFVLPGCGRSPATPPTPQAAPLHLQPLADLAPAAGLTWLVDARPRELAAHAELIPAVDQLVSEARFHAFAEHNGGVDPRSMTELVVARYAASTLWLVRTSIDPARVEAAFDARLVHVQGRALDRFTDDPLGNIVRTWGTFGMEPEQLAIFGREVVAVEIGRKGPLQAAELFAEGRLRRASPALRASPLAHASELLGDAPLRAFAPGPFQGELSSGLGGLLAGTTAVALGARIVGEGASTLARPALACTWVLLGGWGDDAAVAAERLHAAFAVLAESATGRLLGLAAPVAPARVRGTTDALTLEVTIDAFTLARGLRDATGATVDEIMGR